MSMTLRLNDAESAEVREAAAREGVSMQAFAHDAVLDAARGRATRRDAAIQRVVTERGDLLDRLRQA